MVAVKKRETPVEAVESPAKRGKASVTEGMAAEAVEAPPSSPTSAMVVRTVVRESHNEPITRVLFNRTKAGNSSNLFATVGGNQCTVYDSRHFGAFVGMVVHYVHPEGEGELTCLAWSELGGQSAHPKGDEEVAVGTSAGDVLVISVVEAAVTKKLVGHAKPVTHVASSAARPGRLLTLSRDGTARLWSVSEERCLAVFEVGAATSSIAWSPSGGWFVAGTSSGALQQWFVPESLEEGQQEAYVKKVAGESFRKLQQEGGAGLHREEIDCVVFAGRGFAGRQRVVTKSVDGRISAWDAPDASDANDQVTQRGSWKVPGSIKCYSRLDATSDGAYIACGNSGGQVFVYDARGGDCVAKLEPHRLRQEVTCCAISDDHQDVISTLGDGYLFRYRHLPPELVAKKLEKEREEAEQAEAKGNNGGE
ncbi:WD_REPEATS_REGION domain-containing protein [Chloropicon roscoffensis]|uniref:WD_REPEATS_REGION domain-containing protein n=1 Tax=Chloropicon roscoffensis TaxID=1461544 RepID=A0AAX4PEU3_9CHLO